MGQASATLGAAAGQHFAAVGSAHSLAEPVFLGALALFGLVGTEHAIHLFLTFIFSCGGVRRCSTAPRESAPRRAAADWYQAQWP